MLTKLLKFNSPFLRKMLSIFYKEGKFYPILFGPLRGKKCYYTKEINFHMVAGLWELDSFDILGKIIKEDPTLKKAVTVLDIGANSGFYSLFFNKFLHPQSTIFAFEPSNLILPVLVKNLERNNIKNVKVKKMACSDRNGEIDFYVGYHHHTSSLLKEWAMGKTEEATKVVVETIRIDDFCESENIENVKIIKMDIEGGAIYALEGAKSTVDKFRPYIIIESHTPDEDNAISQVLLNYQYKAFRINTEKWVTEIDKNYISRNGVWGTMLLIPNESHLIFS